MRMFKITEKKLKSISELFARGGVIILEVR
jgi:hypothetical protein